MDLINGVGIDLINAKNLDSLGTDSINARNLDSSRKQKENDLPHGSINLQPNPIHWNRIFSIKDVAQMLCMAWVLMTHTISNKLP